MALNSSIFATLLPQHQGKLSNNSNNKSLTSVKNLVRETGISSIVSSPEKSLLYGNWVKLICGASFEDAVDVRNLSLVYTLAGVDCIDCAADESVVNAVNQGIDAAMKIVRFRRPWVMISVNDDEDLHFRKAEFDPADCPLDCSRPCENVCPANAISFENEKAASMHNVLKGGVLTERCYGCGRCFPVCPYDKIREVTYVRDSNTTAELLKRNDVDAIEIHTSGRHITPFKELWHGLGDSLSYLKLVAVSLPYFGDLTVSSMNTMYSVMEPQLNCLNLWQLDGRPMSGDIGRGATRESIAFAVRLAAAKDKPLGFLQLAGGTNAHTVEGLKREGLFRAQSAIGNLITPFLPYYSIYNNDPIMLVIENSVAEKPKASLDSLQASIGGIAYGGYARKIVGRILRSMKEEYGLMSIEDHPDYLLMAVIEALKLVGTVKCYAVP